MNPKLLAAGTAGFLLLSLNGCVLVGAGAGRKSECRQVAGLSRTGEHKPAADSYDALVKSGSGCSESIVEKVARSRSKVDRADNFVRKSFVRRKEGNLLSAQANMEKALQIYPKYYWVQTLLKNQEKSIETEIIRLKGEAQYLESLGDYSGALKRIGEAQALAPDDPALQVESDRLVVARGKAQQDLDIRKVLDSAGKLMVDGQFDEAEKILTQGDAPERLGSRGAEMQGEIARRRTGLIDQRFSVAREAEQKSDIDVAAGHACYVLELSRPDDPTTPEVVEFARLLGVKLYSAGKLIRARELWGAAYDLDPGNDKLATYLKEVNARLESLEKIRGDDGAAK